MIFIKNKQPLKVGDTFKYEEKLLYAEKMCTHGKELIEANPTHAIQVREGYLACNEIKGD